MIPHSQPWILNSDISAFEGCIDSKMLSYDIVSKNLEKKLANYLNKKYALQTGNGTQAQFLLLKALNIGKGDEVIVPTYACDKIVRGIQAAGAIPVLCDVSPFWIMSSDSISRHINAKTKAIILVHIFGINAYWEKLQDFNIPIIEDICQSLGGTADNRTGTSTDYAFTSFHGTKMVSSGEGGMLFVNNEALYEKCKYYQKKSGIICKSSDISACLIDKQFSRIEENLSRREAIAIAYLDNMPEHLVEDFKGVNRRSNNFRFLLRTNKSFVEIQQKFLEENISVRMGVDALNHITFSSLKDNKKYVNAEKLFRTTVSIPILPQLAESDINNIVRTVNKLHSRGVL
jgi:UDP-4-amino-4-deoxy-L-arabinose-oxoglutarate aminotransferase